MHITHISKRSWDLFQAVHAAIIKYLRLGDLNSKYLFLSVLKAWTSKISGWWGPSAWFADGCLFVVSSLGRGGEVYKSTNPTMKVPPSGPHLNLITYQTLLHLQVTLGVMVLAYGETNIQSTAGFSIIFKDVKCS